MHCIIATVVALSGSGCGHVAHAELLFAFTYILYERDKTYCRCMGCGSLPAVSYTHRLAVAQRSATADAEHERLVQHDKLLVERIRRQRNAATEQPTVPRLGEWAVQQTRRPAASGVSRPRTPMLAAIEPVRAFPAASRVDGSAAARPSRVAKALQKSASLASCATPSEMAAHMLTPSDTWAPPSNGDAMLPASRSLATLRFADADVAASTPSHKFRPASTPVAQQLSAGSTSPRAGMAGALSPLRSTATSAGSNSARDLSPRIPLPLPATPSPAAPTSARSPAALTSARVTLADQAVVSDGAHGGAALHHAAGAYVRTTDLRSVLASTSRQPAHELLHPDGGVPTAGHLASTTSQREAQRDAWREAQREANPRDASQRSGRTAAPLAAGLEGLAAPVTPVHGGRPQAAHGGDASRALHVTLEIAGAGAGAGCGSSSSSSGHACDGTCGLATPSATPAGHLAASADGDDGGIEVAAALAASRPPAERATRSLEASRRLSSLEAKLCADLEQARALLPPQGFLSLRAFDDHTYERTTTAAVLQRLSRRRERRLRHERLDGGGPSRAGNGAGGRRRVESPVAE